MAPVAQMQEWKVRGGQSGTDGQEWMVKREQSEMEGQVWTVRSGW